MILSINQPAYLPWLGYFDRIYRSDMHVVLDQVQFEKNSFTNRNKIAMPNGPGWLTIPILTKNKFSQLFINEIEINNQKKWQNKHFKSLELSYKKTAFWELYKKEFESFYYQENYKKLMDVNIKIVQYFLKVLNINKPMVFSSQHHFTKTKSDLILEICQYFKASTYLSGPFGREYLDLESFKASRINVIFHDYIHPVYQQQAATFSPYLSIVDLLFNYGPDSLSILSQDAIKT